MAERRYPHPMPREGISGSVAELVDDVQRLVQLEIELVQQELKELAIRNGIAIGLLLTGGLGVLFALIFAQVALVTWFPLLPAWANALILTLFWIIAAAILFVIGRSRIKIEPPEKTIQSIKDDLEWVKQQIRQVTK